jgi:hypothetical protein
MPARNIKQLNCEFCGKHENFFIDDPAEVVVPIIAKWFGVMNGDAPPRSADDYRWYETLECMISGETMLASHKADEEKKQAEQDKVLARANESLKKSGFMEKQVTQ